MSKRSTTGSGPPLRESLQRGIVVLLLLALSPVMASSQGPARPRARDLGIEVGVFQPGALNAITDVAGVRVGQVTVMEGESVRTGVTAILPHGENVFRSRVPAAIHVGNGFGKLLGVTQALSANLRETRNA